MRVSIDHPSDRGARTISSSEMISRFKNKAGTRNHRFVTPSFKASITFVNP
jgi:hypothetical protein